VSTAKTSARCWIVRGRVQGVGYRYFAQHAASQLGLSGFARNLDDGSVEVYAAGTEEKLSLFAAMLHRGPRWADVRGVEERVETVHHYAGFHIG
jgi:acylphosphatase